MVVFYVSFFFIFSKRRRDYIYDVRACSVFSHVYGVVGDKLNAYTREVYNKLLEFLKRRQGANVAHRVKMYFFTFNLD